MAQPLKYIYNQDFFSMFLKAFEALYPGLDHGLFIHQVFADDWDQLELKERMRRVTKVLHEVLSKNYKEDV